MKFLLQRLSYFDYKDRVFKTLLSDIILPDNDDFTAKRKYMF